MTSPDDLSAITEIAGQLLRQQGLGPVKTLEPIGRGRNNRAFRVAGTNGHWLLKQYFQSAVGGRDRCGSEWAWSTFCWRHGVQCVPQPIACDTQQNCSLFELIQGRHLRRDEIDLTHVEQAAAFAYQVNRAKDAPDVDSIPNAAEACFSIRQHLDCVERRIHRLRSLDVTDKLDVELQDWLTTSLLPTWQLISNRIVAQIDERELSRELNVESRCLSPSDFGFHNALVTDSGELRFLDFEYAGWDDPAKLVCDFFWQQELPAPRVGMASLVSALADQESRAGLEKRIEILAPVYGVKWCCLVLNEFIADDRRRREFSQSVPVTDNQREWQFSMAKQLLIEVHASGARVS